MTEFDLTEAERPVRKHTPARLAALKSGKTVWDGELLATLQSMDESLKVLVQYYQRIFEGNVPAGVGAKRERKTDA